MDISSFDKAHFSHTLLNALPITLSCWTREGRPVFCTDTFLTFFGVQDIHEYLEKYKLFTPKTQPNGEDSAALGVKHLQDAFTQGSTTFLWAHINEQGEMYFADYTLQRITYEGQEVVASYFSDLKGIYTDLYEEKERVQAVFNATPLSITFWNKKGQIIDCNDAALTLHGFSSKEEYFEKAFDIYPLYQENGRKSLELVPEYLNNAFTDGQFCTTWDFLTSDGELVPTEVVLTRIQYNYEEVVVEFTKDLREIKAREAEAKDAEERIQILMDSLPMGVNIWDKNGNLVYCNDESVRLFGVASKEEYFARFFEFSPSHQPCGRCSAELVAGYLEKAFKEGQVHFEWMHVSADGEEMPTALTLFRIRVRDEDLVAAYHWDLREQKKSIKKIRETEERIQVMLDTVPMGAIYWNNKLKIVDCNLSVLQMFGFEEKEDFVQRPIAIFPMHQQDGSCSRVTVRNLFKKTFAEGYCHIELMCRNPYTYEPIPVEVTMVRILHDGEHAVLTFIRDLRELKSSLKKMKVAEERAQAMLDSFPMGANFWDKDFNLIDCNKAVVQLFGFDSKEEFIPNFYRLNPEFQPDGSRSVDKIGQVFEQVRTEGNMRLEWLSVEPHTNEPIPLELTLVRVLHNDEDAIICYVRDLREFNAMLKEIKDVEADLRTARDVAEKNAKAKSEFLANMSHEIRTPMNGIIGLLYILLQEELTAQQKEYVRKCHYSANNLLRIINDILDISKIEAGKLELETIPFTVGTLCEEVKNLYDTRFEDKNIALEIDKGENSHVMLLSDPLRLKQILFNLVSNGLKFTEVGQVIIKVTSVQEKATVMRCTFAVQDSGIGLNAAQVERLFAPFSQADNSVTRKYGGTGLGLAISKNIVEMLGGSMWVESTEGVGSTFYFECRFPIIDNEKATEYTADSANVVAPEHLVHEGHLLLVEDNEINQIIAEELLRSVGYTLDIANNGAQALEMLDKKSYDLVLMDIQMPIMDGLTAAKKIREQEKYATLPVIAMSAHAMDGDKEISLEHGMNDHITKPIAPNVLYSTLHYWLVERVATQNI